MPTQTKENYLKALYFLDQKDKNISLVNLSKEMGVSSPTVNNMIKKLEQKSWVKYEKYKPIRLTVKGRKQAALIVRKHRIAEMFMVKVMGFGWEEVHEIAEEMEHLKSEKLFDRMNELLGYPSVDPHGSPIPDKEGNTEQKDYICLSDAKEGMKVRLCAVSDSSTDLLLFLNRKNIRLGTEINIHQVEPFDQSFQVSYAGTAAAVLSAEVCKRLMVEEV